MSETDKEELPDISPHTDAEQRSSLSHDFYQVLVGKSDMSLSGCRQLFLWSIEHAWLEAEEYGLIRDEWERQWAAFLDWIIETYWDQYMSSTNMRLPS